MAKSRASKCDWCGTKVLEDDGFRLVKPVHNLIATFDRLEHVVPWIMKGPDWHIASGGVELPPDAPTVDSQTGEELGDEPVYLVRHRGEHRIADAFANIDNALEWAKAGGRFAQP